MAKMTAADIVLALREHHGLVGTRLEVEEWALLTEVPLVAAQIHGGGGRAWVGRNKRTIDVLLMRNWSSGRLGFDRLAVEVKVSKSDYRNETDDKRAPAWANAHRCAYACPPGVIEPADLPDGWGLIHVYPEPIRDVPLHSTEYGKRLRWVRKATRHEPTADVIRLMHTIARRASRAEERMRAGDGAPAALAAARIEITRLHARLANVDNRIDRQRQRAHEAMSRLRAQGEQRCADCDGVVKASLHRHNYGTDGFWHHADTEQGERCRMARSEAARAERERATGSRYHMARDYAPPVETRDERAEREREWEINQAEMAEYRNLTTEDDLREENRYG